MITSSSHPSAGLIQSGSPRRKTAPFLHRFCTKNHAFLKPTLVAQQLPKGPLQDGAISLPRVLDQQKKEFGKEMVKKW